MDKSRIRKLEKKTRQPFDMPIIVGFYPEDYNGTFHYKGKRYSMDKLEGTAAALHTIPGTEPVLGFIPKGEA